MKVRFRLLVCGLSGFIWCNAGAQQVHIRTTRFVGGFGTDFLADVVPDPRDKTMVWCGTSDSCGTGDLTACPSGVPSRTDVYVMTVGKMDSSGTPVWTRTFSSPQGAFGACHLTPLKKGGYVVAGGVAGNGGDASGNHSVDPIGSDLWLLRLDEHGTKLWQKCYGGAYNEYACKCIQTSDGGFLLLGTTNSPASGDVPASYANSQFATDWLVVKTDSAGTKQWSKTIGGTRDEQSACIFEVGGAYYIAGGSNSGDHECKDDSWHGATNSGPDYFLIQLDQAGNHRWTRSYGSVAGAEDFNDALFDARDSSFVLVGIGGAADHFVPAAPQLQGARIWALKLDTTGAVRWSRVMGETGAAENRFPSIAEAPGGMGYVIAAEVHPFATPAAGYFGDYDAHLFWVDSGGRAMTDLKLGGTGREVRPHAVGFGGGFLVGGSTESPFLNEGGVVSQRRGFQDVYFSQLDSWPLGVAAGAPSPARIEVFPNPTDDRVTVRIADRERGLLAVYDAAGKTVYQQAVPAEHGSYTLSTKSWPRGTCILAWMPASGLAASSTLQLQ